MLRPNRHQCGNDKRLQHCVYRTDTNCAGQLMIGRGEITLRLRQRGLDDFRMKGKLGS